MSTTITHDPNRRVTSRAGNKGRIGELVAAFNHEWPEVAQAIRSGEFDDVLAGRTQASGAGTGNRPPIGTATGGSDDVEAEWNALVDKHLKAGANRMKARQLASIENPLLHTAYLQWATDRANAWKK